MGKSHPIHSNSCRKVNLSFETILIFQMSICNACVFYLRAGADYADDPGKKELDFWVSGGWTGWKWLDDCEKPANGANRKTSVSNFQKATIDNLMITFFKRHIYRTIILCFIIEWYQELYYSQSEIGNIRFYTSISISRLLLQSKVSQYQYQYQYCFRYCLPISISILLILNVKWHSISIVSIFENVTIQYQYQYQYSQKWLDN